MQDKYLNYGITSGDVGQSNRNILDSTRPGCNTPGRMAGSAVESCAAQGLYWNFAESFCAPTPQDQTQCAQAGWYWNFSSNQCSQTLPQPTNLYAYALSSYQISLQWTDNSNAETGYKIERDYGSGFEQITWVGANSTSYIDSNLAAGTTYYYRVRAFNNAGDSDYSGVAGATTQATPQCGGPCFPDQVPPGYSGCQSVDYCYWSWSNGCDPVLINVDGSCCCMMSPIVIDVLGNGFDLTSASGGVYWLFGICREMPQYIVVINQQSY
jgi:hypothetical protein